MARRAGCPNRRRVSPAGARQDRQPLQDSSRRLSRRLMQLVQQQHGDHIQAGHEVYQAVRVDRSERVSRPASSSGESRPAVSSAIAGCMAAATVSPGAARTSQSGHRAQSGHRRCLIPARAGVLAVPAAARPPAALSGRGVRHVVLPPSGRAGPAVLAMDPHIRQREAGWEVVHHRRLADARRREAVPVRGRARTGFRASAATVARSNFLAGAAQWLGRTRHRRIRCTDSVAPARGTGGSGSTTRAVRATADRGLGWPRRRRAAPPAGLPAPRRPASAAGTGAPRGRSAPRPAAGDDGGRPGEAACLAGMQRIKVVGVEVAQRVPNRSSLVNAGPAICAALIPAPTTTPSAPAASSPPAQCRGAAIRRSQKGRLTGGPPWRTASPTLRPSWHARVSAAGVVLPALRSAFVRLEGARADRALNLCAAKM